MDRWTKRGRETFIKGWRYKGRVGVCAGRETVSLSPGKKMQEGRQREDGGSGGGMKKEGRT